MQHDIIMPVLGMNQDTGVIASWYKKPGDVVEEGDVVMDVETDKAVMEIEARHAGYLAAIHYEAGSEVPVGTVVAVIDTEQSEIALPQDELIQTESVQEAKAQPVVNESSTKAVVDDQPDAVERNLAENNIVHFQDKRILSSPRARTLAGQHGIPMNQVAQHANQSPLHAKDVLAYIESASQADHTGQATNSLPNQCALSIQVKAQPLLACEEWLQQQDKKHLTLGHLVAFLAVDKLRKQQLFNDIDLPYVRVDTWAENAFHSSSYQHAPQVRFSSLECWEDDHHDGDIRLIDMSGCALMDISFSAVSRPMIIMQSIQDAYTIKMLGFGELQFTDLAIVCQDLATALEQPLLNLA